MLQMNNCQNDPMADVWKEETGFHTALSSLRCHTCNFDTFHEWCVWFPEGQTNLPKYLQVFHMPDFFLPPNTALTHLPPFGTIKSAVKK